MFAGHKHAPRRSADSVAGIMLRQAHAFARHPVETGRKDLLLAKNSYVAVTEIVGEDEDDVRVGWLGGGESCGRQ